MSLDERVTREVRRQAAQVDGSQLPAASEVAGRARRRVRRRRMGGGLALVAVLALAGSVARAATDDPDRRTDIRTEVPSTLAPSPTVAPTTPPTVTVTIPGTTTTNLPARTTRAVATCSPPALFTDMPEGWGNVVRQGAGGGSSAPGAHLSGGQGRYIDVFGDDAPFPATSSTLLALPQLGVEATVFEIHEGVAARIPIATSCGDSFTLAGYGISAAEFDRVLLGMRPESECSAASIDPATPSSLSPSSALPAEVRSTADKVRRLAIECDFTALGAMASTGVSADNDFTLDYDVPLDIAAADWWRSREAWGDPVMRHLAGILTLEPYRFDFENEPSAYYFPRFCRDPLTGADWDALVPIYGADEVASWRETNARSEEFRNSYVGGRCTGFAVEDGHWTGLFTLIA